MKNRKWILGTVALAIGLSTGAFADNPHRDRGRDDDDAAYSQRYSHDRDDAWNNNFRDRDREWNDRDRETRERDHRDRDRDHDRDRDRRYRDDRGRDRD